MYPRSNCIPSTVSTVISIFLDSSTVITPSFPTFSIASASILPISGSLFAEIVAIFVISSAPFTGFAFFLISSTAIFTALSIPRFNSIGVIPAATDFTPSRTKA